MSAIGGSRGATAFKPFLLLEPARFYFMCFEKADGKEGDGCYCIHFGGWPADRITKPFVHRIVFILIPENIQDKLLLPDGGC